jgi:WD40 repeat protein
VDQYGDPLPEYALARFGTMRLRHGFTVFGVAYAPDGKTLASASGDGTVRTWEASTGKEKQTFTIDGHQMNSVVYFGDGKFLAAGTANGNIQILDVEAGRVKTPLAGLAHGQITLALHRNQHTLFSGSMDGIVREWDLEKGTEVRKLTSAPGSVFALAVSGDGKTLAVAKQSGTWQLLLFDLDSGKEKKTVPWGAKGQIDSLAFAADGKSLVIAGQSAVLGLYDVESGKEIQPFRANNFFGQVKAIALSPSGKILASTAGPSLLLWGVATGKELLRLECPPTGVMQLAYSPDGKTVAAACADHTVRLWNVETGQEVNGEAGLSGTVQAIRFLKDGKTLVAGDALRHVRAWDVNSGKAHSVLQGIAAPLYVGWGVAADGMSIAYPGFDRCLHFWDPVAGKEIRKLESLPQVVNQAAFSQDGKVFAMSDNNRVVHFHHTETGREFKQLTPTSDRVQIYGLTLSSDGRRLASAVTGPVQVWDVATGAPLWKAEQDANRQVQRSLFSPDGKTLAVISGFQFQILEIASRQERARVDRQANTLKPQTTSILAYSPDGAVLAAGGPTGEVALFDVATCKKIGTVAGHRGQVQALTFSPDGSLLASGGNDTTVLVWDAARLIKRDQPSVDPLQANDLATLWQDLAGDPSRAHRLIWMMKADPTKALAVLAKHLEPGSLTDAKQIDKLITELDSDDFDVREKASAALATMPEADDALRKTLEGKPSLEVRRRIEALFDTRKAGTVNLDKVREARAIEALELVGGPDARTLLDKLAKGPSEAALTQDAKAALDRLSQKEATPP